MNKKKWLQLGKMSKNKWITLGVILVLVCGGGFWAYKHFKSNTAAPAIIKGNAAKGTVTKSISATGTVKYAQSIDLSFQQTSSTATKLVVLNAKVGDKVKAGQVLAQLDTTNLKLAVAQQNANLAIAQAKLQTTMEGLDSSVKSTISNATQAVTAAQDSLRTAQQQADPAYLTNKVFIAKQGVQQASNDLAKAQLGGDASSISSAQNALVSAQSTLDAALSSQNGGAAANLAAAQSKYDAAMASLEVAQNQMNKYSQGVRSADVLSAEAAITQAQASLDTAQTNLDSATLTAPTDGTIINVAVENYQTVSGSTVIMTLAGGDNDMEIQTAVDQSDIGKVQVGQKANITIDSAPNNVIGGTVMQVALAGTTASNVTTYTVKVQVDQPSDLLRQGMSANVNIIQEQAKDVLTVSSAAIKTAGELKYVLISGQGQGGNTMKGIGQIQQAEWRNLNVYPVQVEVGLDDGTNAEIKSGLTEGQEIVVSIKQATAAKSSSSSNSGSGSFGGSSTRNSMGAMQRATGSGRPPGN